MKTGKPISLLILPLLAMLMACDGKNLPDDNFHDTGFIGDDRFQIVVKIAPAENARGLVQRRESAMKAAESILVERVVSEMWNFCLKQYQDSTGDNKPVAAEKEKRFRLKAAKYAKKGASSLEYFDENDAVTIVYRIDRKNLKKTIMTLAEETFGEKNGQQRNEK